MSAKGLLIVVTSTPPAFEEEFNAWYDLEHIPERAGIAGFQSALRYISCQRPQRYLALYDLETIGVLDSPAYQAFAGANFTPWTKRVVARAHFERLATSQFDPAGDATLPASRQLLLSFAGVADPAALARGTETCFSGHPHLVQTRVLVETGERAGHAHVLVGGHGAIERRLDPGAFGDATLVRSEWFSTYL